MTPFYRKANVSLMTPTRLFDSVSLARMALAGRQSGKQVMGSFTCVGMAEGDQEWHWVSPTKCSTHLEIRKARTREG